MAGHESGKDAAGKPRPRFNPAAPYLWTVLLVALVTAIGNLVVPFFDIVNVTLLYLLPVLFSAVRWGRGPSLFASFLGVLTFDFFFVPPIHSFAVSDIKYTFTFAVFLLVGVVTGTLATRIRNELEKTRQREKRTLALYALSEQIASKADLYAILDTFLATVSEAVGGPVSVMTGEAGGAIREVAAYPRPSAPGDDKEMAVVHWVLEHGTSAGRGTETLRDASRLIFPVKADGKTLAALCISPGEEKKALSPEKRQLIEAFANLAAVAIIRLRLAQEEGQVQRLAESARLHKALLDSISHDIRTPLASITGAVTTLMAEGGSYDAASKEILLDTIKEGALRLNRFVANLLDTARLESGTLKLHADWCDVQDIAGAALREIADRLHGRSVPVDIPGDLPPVRVDFALIEHVLINLIENAAKYSPPGSGIALSASAVEKAVLVSVTDHGPPIPSLERERIFDKFYRLERSKGAGGSGLGLSTCRGIVEAHGGMIWVDSPMGSGNRFTFSLPL
jgi:two-component system sensor histidine kinase KdpD